MASYEVVTHSLRRWTLDRDLELKKVKPML